MNINSPAELKALEALADLFMTNEDFRNLIMDEVEVEAKQVVAHI